MQYRKYDPMIKKLILKTGNRELFPDKNIPRTTINYWFESSREVLTSEANQTYEVAIDSLRKEILKRKLKLT